jgi:hypothetical protein
MADGFQITRMLPPGPVGYYYSSDTTTAIIDPKKAKSELGYNKVVVYEQSKPHDFKRLSQWSFEPKPRDFNPLATTVQETTQWSF